MLLLDEMLPKTIAERLTEAGYDTQAVSARADLQGVPDGQVLETAAREGRIIVTDNIRDFVPLSNAWAHEGRTHPGLILISSKAFPMTKGRGPAIAAALLAHCSNGHLPQPRQYVFLQPT